MKKVIAVGCALAGAWFGTCAADVVVKVDFDAKSGPVKPVNGVGQGPLISWIDTSLFPYLQEAGVPFARLHDVGGPFGGNRFVDVPNIFRDFDADEEDPKNYDFRFTDKYLQALVDNGVEPFYRLGVTIENVSSSVGPLRVHPPKDFAKWARICEHIVRHYTKGWANGYHWKIRYWEIWNEPEDVNGTRQVMWLGTFKQYCELYDVTAKHLKKMHPEIKVGGYAACGFYSVYGDMGDRSMHARYSSFTKNFDEFLAYIKEHNSPLDFFSYHTYDTVDNVMHYMDYPRKKLDAAGYAKTEISLNEWLTWSYPTGSAAQAAFVAAMMVEMQKGPVDTAMIYDARCQISACSPLFRPQDNDDWSRPNQDKGVPRKPYYAMLYFNELRKLGTAVACTTAQGSPIHAAAARDDRGRGAILIANVGDQPAVIKIDAGRWSTGVVRVTDDKRTDELTIETRRIPAHAALLVRMRDVQVAQAALATDGVGK